MGKISDIFSRSSDSAPSSRQRARPHPPRLFQRTPSDFRYSPLEKLPLSQLAEESSNRQLDLSNERFFNLLQYRPDLLSKFDGTQLLSKLTEDGVIQLPFHELANRLSNTFLAHLIARPGERSQQLRAYLSEVQSQGGQSSAEVYEDRSFSPNSGSWLSVPNGSPPEGIPSGTDHGDQGLGRGQYPPQPSRLSRPPRSSSRDVILRSNSTRAIIQDDSQSGKPGSTYSEPTRGPAMGFRSEDPHTGRDQFLRREVRSFPLRAANEPTRGPQDEDPWIQDLQSQVANLENSNRELERKISDAEFRMKERKEEWAQDREQLNKQMIAEGTMANRIQLFLQEKKFVPGPELNTQSATHQLLAAAEQYYSHAGLYFHETAKFQQQLAEEQARAKNLGRQLDLLETANREQKREIDNLNADLAQADKKVAALNHLKGSALGELSVARDKLQDTEKKNQELNQMLKEIGNKWGVKMENQRKSYEERERAMQEQLNKLELKRQGELRKKDEEHAALTKKNKEAHDRDLADQKNQHAQSVVELERRVVSLEGDLVDNSDDFRPATDDALKVKYRELKLAIETITFNLGATTIPRSSGLDPSGFLAREGKGQLRFLLQSIVWSRVIDGFFSAPFGFGALGSREGKEMLTNLYKAWRRIFDAQPLDTLGYYAREEKFEIFQNDKEANKWRSATFQSIYMAMFPKGARKAMAPSGGMVRAFIENRDRVYDEICDTLKTVSRDGVTEEIEQVVDRIVKVAGELALEFGSQRAQLGLTGPKSEEFVTIGPEFIDCQDGDTNRGVLEEVDLLVSPKLFRIGDGRNDLKTEKIIFPAEIYPRRQSSFS